MILILVGIAILLMLLFLLAVVVGVGGWYFLSVGGMSAAPALEPLFHAVALLPGIGA